MVGIYRPMRVRSPPRKSDILSPSYSLEASLSTAGLEEPRISPLGPAFALDQFGFSKGEHMRKLMIPWTLLVAFVGVPMLAACDETVSHERTVERDDDKVVTREKEVRETDDGKVITEEKKSVDRDPD
jgi:hypothetical protein